MKKMKPKTTLGLLILSTCLVLTGCCIRHDWADATCTKPKTCVKCGKTEGNALGHTYAEDKDSESSACEVCGEVVGGESKSDFEKYGIACNVEENVEYDYLTICQKDNSKNTVGKAVFSNYRTFASDDAHPAKEGYEWKSIEITVVYSDDNALEFGPLTGFCYTDYYDIELFDVSLEWEDSKHGHFSYNWNGVEYTECEIWQEGKTNQDEHAITHHFTQYVLLPEGYNGYVTGLRNDSIHKEAGEHFYKEHEDFLLFRFQ